MGIWKATQIPLPPQMPPGGQMDIEFLKTTFDYAKKLANTISAIRNDLEFMLNGHLDANNIRANSIETKNLKAGAVTADKIDVNELSAITANLGHIISGLIESVEIFGSYISTNRTGYPRAEMSNTDNMFGAYKSSNNSIQIYSPVDRLSPIILFTANGINSFLFYDPADNTFSVTSNYANIDISTQGDIQLYGNSVRLSGWNSLWSNGESKTLKQELDAIDQRLRNLGG